MIGRLQRRLDLSPPPTRRRTDLHESSRRVLHAGTASAALVQACSAGRLMSLMQREGLQVLDGFNVDLGT